MTRGVPLLLLGLSGCAHYAKLQNPSPIEDLKSSVRLESLSHATIHNESESRITIRVRIEVPEGATVSTSDTVAQLLDDGGRIVGYGVHRVDGVPGPPRIWSSATTARINVPVLPSGAEPIRSGVSYGLRLSWQQSPSPGATFVPRQSRSYRIRVQKVNFAPMVAIGAVPLAVLLVLVSK